MVLAVLLFLFFLELLKKYVSDFFSDFYEYVFCFAPFKCGMFNPSGSYNIMIH